VPTRFANIPLERMRGATLLAMANILDLDGVQWDLDSIPTSSSMTAAVERIQAIQQLGPSGLLAVGSLEYANTSTDATRLLVDEYGFDRVRAASAVRLARKLNLDGGRGIHPLGYLADVAVTGPQARSRSTSFQPEAWGWYAQLGSSASGSPVVA